VRPLDEETLKELQTRGEKFNKIALGSHYLSYQGKMLYNQGNYSVT